MAYRCSAGRIDRRQQGTLVPRVHVAVAVPDAHHRHHCRSVQRIGSASIMRKLSTGDDSTLGNYRSLTAAAFGRTSKAVAYLDQKIKESPNGENEEVIADERQMIQLLAHIDRGQ